MRARDLLFLSLLLTACGNDDATGPSPPANLTGELAYIGDGIVIRNFSTGQTRTVELNTEGLGAVWGMAWQPDGRALAYSVFNFARSTYELHRVPADGSPTTVPFPNQAQQLAPAFTPDGRLSYWVGFTELGGEFYGFEIFVNGQPASPRLPASWGSRAAWSPDGASVVIVRRSEGVDQLLKVSLATGAETVVLEASGAQNVEQMYNPVYSHTGDRLALTRIFFGPDHQSERDEIWVVGADGSNPQRLVTGHSDDMPTWSPDDAWIAFTRTEEPVASIAVVSATGGPVSILVKGAIAADWR